MKTKIQNKKVVYSCGRVVCNGSGMEFSKIIVMVENYLYCIRKLKELSNLVITHVHLNTGIHFNMFNMIITVGKLFELYNEIATIENEKAKEEVLRVYTKLNYNPSGSVKICPIN